MSCSCGQTQGCPRPHRSLKSGLLRASRHRHKWAVSVPGDASRTSKRGQPQAALGPPRSSKTASPALPPGTQAAHTRAHTCTHIHVRAHTRAHAHAHTHGAPWGSTGWKGSAPPGTREAGRDGSHGHPSFLRPGPAWAHTVGWGGADPSPPPGPSLPPPAPNAHCAGGKGPLHSLAEGAGPWAGARLSPANRSWSVT